jgi:hypothetical protein
MDSPKMNSPKMNSPKMNSPKMNSPSTSGPRRKEESLWAITAYFNPAGYRRRLANYRVFRERLTVPLIAVELAYGPNFELNENDAEILVQLRGGDVLWQKERLLNLALRELPRHCKNVVWVDCDIVFGSDEWPKQVNRLLQDSCILQTFSHAYDLRRDSVPTDLRPTMAEFSREAAAFAIASGVPAASCLGEIPRTGFYNYSRGYTWAARRELLDQHGFYDACIIGSGDKAIAGAVYGCYDVIMDFLCMNDRQKAHYLAWAKTFHEMTGAAAGFNGNIYHLWHGEMRDRRSRERQKLLAPFDFDPFEDIVIGDTGCWRWNTNKPEMHAYVKNYFAARNEDG